jgi:hypothetical protein
MRTPFRRCVPGHPAPLNARGGTGLTRKDIDHFVLWTLDGKRQLSV